MSRLCLITALPAETRPLLDALKLRQINSPQLRLYGSEQYLLLETGAGKLNAASATGAVLTAYSDINAVANIGIAGGRFEYASTIVANRVRDAASGAQWFPHLPALAAFKMAISARVDTVDKPCTDYHHDVLFDMEAAGIFSAASRYLSTSQIHSIKVVSDNPQHATDQITKQSVIQLIHQSLPVIMPMLDALKERVATLTASDDKASQDLVQKALLAVHHSVNDERQLQQLVMQYIALTGEQPTLDLHGSSAASIRKALQRALTAQPFVYGKH